MNFFRVLANPSIALLWASQVLSALGDQLFSVALLWLATRQLGGSAGLLFGTATFLALLFGLFGGTFADRWNRRITLVGIDVMRSLLVGLLALLLWTQGLHVWYIVVVILGVELLGTIFDPALQASLPLLVTDAKTLYETNGLMDTTHRFARVIGPGMTGILLLFLSFLHFFTLDAVSFVISALALLVLGSRLVPHATSRQPQHTQESRRIVVEFVQEMRVGYRLSLSHKAFLWSVLSLGVINLAWSAAFTIGVPLWIQHVLHGSPAVLGLLVSAYGVGNVVSLFVGTLGKSRPLSSMYLGKILQGAGFMVFALTSNGFIAVGSMFLSAVGGGLGDLTLATMIQTDFPSEHIGKVYSFRKTIGNLGLTLGSLIASLLYLILSVPVAILLCAILMMMTGVICLLRFSHA